MKILGIGTCIIMRENRLAYRKTLVQCAQTNWTRSTPAQFHLRFLSPMRPIHAPFKPTPPYFIAKLHPPTRLPNHHILL